MTSQSKRFRIPENWAAFCLAILLLKLLLFAIDPVPKLFMGDSASYLWTALSGWLPDDRSYFYGFVIRWTSAWSESLTSLLLLQLFLSAATCVLLATICRFAFGLSERTSFVFGLLCALDPIQLLYERYVMTEAISLFLYALALQRVFFYLKHRRWWDLAPVQAVSVFLIGFRMSYLMLVQINTILLPLIAFGVDAWDHWRNPVAEKQPLWPTLRTCGTHLLISFALLFTLHTGYKQLNGLLSSREPGYLYATGITVLAFWAPALQPEDSPDSRLAEIIRRGDEIGLGNYRLRNNQRFSPGRLVDQWKKLEPDRAKMDNIAKATALHAFRRNPFAVLKIAWQTYADYWSLREMKKSIRADFSINRPPSEGLISTLASHFHFAYLKGAASALQRYYFAAWPYYFFVLLAPVIGAVALVPQNERKHALLLFIHVSQMVVIAMLFGGDTVRFLQPISFVTLLIIALLIKATLTKHSSGIADTMADGKAAAAA